MKNKRKVIGYLRVSTVDQDTDKNEADILKFANTHDFGKVEFVSEKVSGTTSWKKRKLFDVVQGMKEGDVLIVPELSRLGRSLVNVLDVLNELSNRKVKVYSVKEAFQLNGDDIQSKVMRTMLSLFAEIERDLISARTKEGLAAARLEGRIGGRPKGVGKSKLDMHREVIIKQIKIGVKRKIIAKRFGVTGAGLLHWLTKHGLNDIEAQP
jgi:DNA invertase Pin-like site-specific DNA recombinase